tara:strand:- start:39 stop:317 length:279 start_codon:yes stop_codon:yes gene_type:complete
MKKQTAVEFLVKEFSSILEKLNFTAVQGLLLKDALEKAKEMEKEQITNSYVTGHIDPLIMKNYKGLSVDEIRIELKKQAKEYYNETFKKEIK